MTFVIVYAEVTVRFEDATETVSEGDGTVTITIIKVYGANPLQHINIYIYIYIYIITLPTIGGHMYTFFKKIINPQECMGKLSLGYI